MPTELIAGRGSHRGRAGPGARPELPTGPVGAARAQEMVPLASVGVVHGPLAVPSGTPR